MTEAMLAQARELAVKQGASNVDFEFQFPVAVRYSWSDNPDGNLYNTAELPASPFRTDDWKITTEGKH